MQNIQKQMTSAIRRRIKPSLQKDARARVKVAKRELVEDIQTNPISEEIASKGFLFGFLGFNEHEEPIKDLAALYEASIHITTGATHVTGKYINFYVRLPSREQLLHSNTLDWNSSIPWVELIEIGIPGLQYFLRKDGIGRSQGGIQVKGVLPSMSSMPQDMPGRSYITDILAKFKKNLRKKR
jgi:hypothetical protein